MERNWLIRTSQNQILGPVAKQKLLEFIEKGALGLNDEVASGNGYWFSLREKELVEKYIYGDIPQGYNPISESKSVLSKRENPEKTTSINTAPANRGQLAKVENSNDPGVLPKNDDLEFPDIGAISGTPSKTDAKPQSQVDNTDLTRLPSADDLEFPDITLVAKNTANVSAPPPSHSSSTAVHAAPMQSATAAAPASAKPRVIEEKKSEPSSEQIAYPKDEDLDFPDVDAIRNAEEKKEKTLEFKIDPGVTQTIAIPKEAVPEVVTRPAQGPRDLESDFGDMSDLTLTMVQPKAEPQPQAQAKVQKPAREPKDIVREKKEKEGLRLEKRRDPPPKEELREEDKKLLHDRKVKSSQPARPVRENREVVSIETAPVQLKKRNDNYIFFILIILALILFAVFFYFREILNKPLPV